MEISEILYEFLIWCSKNSECGLCMEEFYGREKELINEFLKKRLPVDTKKKSE